jgi:hypothetical protein
VRLCYDEEWAKKKMQEWPTPRTRASNWKKSDQPWINAPIKIRRVNKRIFKDDMSTV